MVSDTNDAFEVKGGDRFEDAFAAFVALAVEVSTTLAGSEEGSQDLSSSGDALSVDNRSADHVTPAADRLVYECVQRHRVGRPIEDAIERVGWMMFLGLSSSACVSRKERLASRGYLPDSMGRVIPHESLVDERVPRELGSLPPPCFAGLIRPKVR